VKSTLELQVKSHYHLTLLLEERSVNLKIIFNEVVEELEGNLHSCFSMNIYNHLIMFDEFNLYKFLPDPHSDEDQCIVFKGHNSQGVYTMDGNYCYSLSHSGDEGR